MTLNSYRALANAARLALLVVSAAAAVAIPAGASAHLARPAAAGYLQLAESGVARAQLAFRDHRSKHGHGDVRWYDERLNDRDTYPLATIWGAVPLFEALDSVDIAQPSPSAKHAVDSFARGAERYWDRSLKPHGGYAPYPNDRGNPQTWFDDNGWWGLAFFDAWRATHEPRYLKDAERAFDYVAAAGWDPVAGGLWWNTSHPEKSGVAMGVNSLLGSKLYGATGQTAYRDTTERYITWATQHLWNSQDELYAQSNFDATSQPYVEGAFIEADETICQAAGDQSYCRAARTLADRAYNRFTNRYSDLQMGPQFDTIYLRVMLEYGQATGDGRWLDLAEREAGRALANAATPAGLYLRAWDGSDMLRHQAAAGMLRTDASTVDLFASLAAAGA